MRHYEKLLARLSPALRRRVFQAMEDIMAGRTSHLDRKKIKGAKNVWRVRVGPLRILYHEEEGILVPDDIVFRKDAYR